MNFARDFTLYAIAAVGVPAVARAFARWFSRERQRPPLASYDEAPGDCWPDEITLSHFGTHSTEA